MWLRTVDGNYYNPNTDKSLGVVEARAGGEYRVSVLNAQSNTAVVCVQKGYRTREDAEEALTNVFAGEDVIELDVPEYDDESDEDTEDEESEGTSYEDMTVEDLRTECSERTPPLPTNGKKADLIARLREDDERQEAANTTAL